MVGILNVRKVRLAFIMMMIIIIHISYITAVYLVPQKSTVGLTEHILFLVLPKTFRTERYVLSTTAFCISICSIEESGD